MGHGTAEDGEFVFRCPECEERLEVNGGMKEALVRKGCVICGAAVTPAAFTEAPEDGG